MQHLFFEIVGEDTFPAFFPSGFIDPRQPQEERIFFAGSSWPANQTAGLLLPSSTGPSRPLAAVGTAVKSRAIHRITGQALLEKKRRIGSGQSRFTDIHGYPIPPYPAAPFGKSGTKRSGARHRLPKGSCFFSCFSLFLEMMRFILDKEATIKLGKCPFESISMGSNPLKRLFWAIFFFFRVKRKQPQLDLSFYRVFFFTITRCVTYIIFFGMYVL